MGFAGVHLSKAHSLYNLVKHVTPLSFEFYEKREAAEWNTLLFGCYTIINNSFETSYLTCSFEELKASVL